MTSVAIEGATNGDAVMGNEASRVEIKHDTGDSEKPGQFHRVLVDPDYSEIDTPTLTKVSVTEGLETVPQLQTPSSSQDSNVESVDKAEDKELTVIAKELVDNVITTAVTKVNGETETKEITIPNGKIVSTEQTADNVQSDTTLAGKSEKLVPTVKEKAACDTKTTSGNIEASKIPTTVNDSNSIDSSLDSQDTTDLVKSIPSQVNAEGLALESAEDLPQVDTEGLSQRHSEVSGEGLKSEPENETSNTSAEDIISKIATPDKLKKKDKTKKKKAEQNKRERELIESVKNEFGEIKPELNDKKSGKRLGFMKMFKFSKNKPNAVSDISSNNLDEKEARTVIDNLNDNTEKINLESTPAVGHTTTNHVDNKQVNPENQTCTIQNGHSYNKDIIEIDSNVSGVKRMNSLDSGIVVEKVSELQPDTKDIDIKPSVSSNQTSDHDVQLTGMYSDNHSNKSTIEKILPHVNGEQLKEVVTDFNERGVDIGDIAATTRTKEISNEVKEALLDNSKETVNTPSSGNSPVGLAVRKMSTGGDKDSVASDLTTESDEKPKSVKLKKKSWSFQIGGSKKKVEGLETTDEAKDKTANGGEVKKPRWRFGKLSFRRQTSDVTVSTPNLTQTGIPEEVVTNPDDKKKDDKKKNKLKKIKAKKEQKKEAKKREEEARTSRSNSMLEGVLGDLNRPGSRRSIVEEDSSYATTDAFDGVDLADLSADEDVQVPKDTTGTDAKPESKSTGFAAKAIGFFKSDKKKSPSSPTTQEKPKSLDNLYIIEDGEYAQIRQDKDTENMTKPSVDTEAIKASPKEQVIESAEGVRDSVGALYAQVVRHEKEEESNNMEDEKESVKQTEESPAVNTAISSGETTKDSVSESFAISSNSVSDKADVKPVDVKQPDIELSFTDQVLQSANNVMKGETTDTDSDAYVQLEQLVTDIKPTQQVTDIDSEHDEINTEQIVEEIKTGTESKPDHQVKEMKVDLQLVETKPVEIKAEITQEVFLKQEAAPKVSSIPEMLIDKVTDSGKKGVDNTIESAYNTIDETVKCGKDSLGNIEQDTECIAKYCSQTKIELVQPVSVNSTYMAPAVKEKPKSRVIIMKEVGVQAPDIHMPLDIEKDFGFNTEQLPTVSIGVQVSDGTTEEIHQHTDMGKITQNSNKISPAYF